MTLSTNRKRLELGVIEIFFFFQGVHHGVFNRFSKCEIVFPNKSFHCFPLKQSKSL